MASTDEPISFNNREDLKTYFLTLTPQQAAALAQGSNYRGFQNSLASLGWVNIFFGGLTFLLAIGIPGETPLKTFQMIVGLLIILLCLWSIVRPSPVGSNLWTIGFGICGVYNTFVSIHYQSLIAGILGLLQLWWAYRMYYDARDHPPASRPDAKSLRIYDTVQRAVRRYSGYDNVDPESIRLKFSRRWWQGYLLQDWIVLAPQRGNTLLIAERNSTTFTFKDGKGLWGPRIVGTVDLGGSLVRRVTIPRTTLERCNRWRGVPDDQTSRWLADLDLNTRKRLPVRILIVAVLAAPIVFLLVSVVSLIMMVNTYGW